MSSIRARVAVVTATSVAALAVVLTIWIQLQSGWELVDRQGSGPDIAAGLIAITWTLTGATLAWLRPRNILGWLLTLVGVFQALSQVLAAYGGYGLVVAEPALPVATWAAWLGAALWLPGLLPLGNLLLALYPDGRLRSRLWRWLVIASATGIALITLGALLDGGSYHDIAPGNSPMSSPRVAFVAYIVGAPLMLGGTLAIWTGSVLRLLRAESPERQQLAWLLCVVLPFVVSTFGLSLPKTVFDVLALLIPVAVGVGVLRYRLLGIEVSKALLVAGLAGFITVVYVAIVVGIGSLVGAGDKPKLSLSVAATAVVAVAFQPVRRALERLVNRLVYGQRATPYDVLSGFATRVGAAEPSADTLVRLAELMAGGTGAKPARVWLRVGPQLRPTATWPPGADAGPAPAAVDVDTAADTVLPDADLAVPVRERGELLGVLTIAKPRGERVTEADADLLGRLAAASGVVLRNLRLDAELAQRLADLEASRRRLLSAQNDARQRIEADLAGGSRAQLGELRERLSGLVRTVDSAHSPKTALLLSQLVAATDGALSTLDGLAAGIYPPRLASEGLAAALTEQAAKAAVPTSVHAAGVGRYPAEVEVAVYFSVLEALQNTAKYAGATSAQVRLRPNGDHLHFEVADDGGGFDPTTTSLGTGLQGIADRLDTVGGAMVIESTPGEGTTVVGRVPVDVAVPAGAAFPELTGARR